MIQISIQRTKIESRRQNAGAWTAWVGIGGGSTTDGHTHDNKSALDKITESGGLPLWNNAAWPGGGEGGAGINDAITSLIATWSSSKINGELGLKENAGTAESLVTQLIDGATDNTLKKLQDKIVAINAIIGGSTADGDNIVNTVAELLAVFSTFPDGSDMVTLLAAKLNTSDVYNALDRVLEGKALDARQGKVLNDLIAELREDLNSLTPSLPDNSIENTKLVQVPTATIKGRASEGTGNVEDLTIEQVKTLLGFEHSLYVKDTVAMACSDETSDLTASTSVSKIHYVFRDAFTRTLNSIVADLNTAPTGSSLTIDIKKNDTSIFSTLLTIDASETSNASAAIPYVLTGAVSFVAGDYIDVFVTITGSTTAGKGLKINLLTTKS